MIYPHFLQKGDTIGVTAPSDGVTNEQKLNRLNNAIKNINKLGFKVIESDNVRTSERGRSSDKITRAKQFEELLKNKEVKLINFSGGGDFLLEILPYIDFNLISENIKWLQGYSDPTGILYVVTTWLDIATIYGNNFISYGMEPWHKSLENNISIVTSNIIEQNNFDYYEQDYMEYITGLEDYNLSGKVKIKRLYSDENIEFKGRMIGGCLDVILSLIGTKYDKTLDFLERYKTDGFIWYFDNCELSNDAIIRAMWQLKNALYFKYCKGIIFGRTGNDSSYYEVSFKEALQEAFSDIEFQNVPIIYGVDIGHKPPQWTIINGALATLKYQDEKLKINFELK